MEISLVETRPPLRITREEIDGTNIKYIPNTNERFAVSKLGAVYSFSTKRGGKQIGSPGPWGYRTCAIVYADGKRKSEYIHRLIAEAFIPNPEGKKQVSHINEQKDDNRAENLCWASSKENCNWGNHNEKLATSIREYWRNRDSFGNVPRRVVVMDKNDKILYIAPSIQKAADYIKEETGKDDNSSSVQITGILQGRPGFKSVGGFKVREATEDEYTKWVAANINKTLENAAAEDNLELSVEQIKKLNKIEGVTVVVRRLNVETGKMEVEEREFEQGEKIDNELH